MLDAPRRPSHLSIHGHHLGSESKMKHLLSRRLSRTPVKGPNSPPLDAKSIKSITSSKSSMTVSGVLGRAFSRHGHHQMSKDHQALYKDYKKLLKAFDSQKPKVWKSVATNLVQKDAALRLVETSSDSYPQEIRDLSHELIFRLVLTGSLTFSEKWTQKEDDGNGNANFIHEHVEFLASTYPASLLLAMAHAKGDDTDAHKFLIFVSSVWGAPDSGSDLHHVTQKCSALLSSYSTHPLLQEDQKNSIDANLLQHSSYILSCLAATEEGETEATKDHYLDDLSLFVGFFPWMYFKLEPIVSKEKEWTSRSLSIDESFLTAITASGLFCPSDPHTKQRIMKNMAMYYSSEESSNTAQHLVMYLWALEIFGYLKEGGEEKVELPNGLEANLKESFKPGCWIGPTFYTCTNGETILRSLSSPLFQSCDPMTLIRFIALNLKQWSYVKQGSLLEYGMIRTLFLGMVLVNEKNGGGGGIWKEGEGGLKDEELKRLIWCLGKFLEEAQNSSLPQSTKPSIIITNPSTSEKEEDVIGTLAHTSLSNFGSFEKACQLIPPPSSLAHESEESHHKRTLLKNVLCTAILRELVHTVPTTSNQSKLVYEVLKSFVGGREGGVVVVTTSPIVELMKILQDRERGNEAPTPTTGTGTDVDMESSILTQSTDRTSTTTQSDTMDTS